MSIVNLVSLGGGVALFLYGMTVMGNGLEKLSGGKMEKALERLTNNIFASVALGAVVTALIQSSSATTVLVVGLVNAGILQLRQAVGVIMGANIGTTITAQIIRLSDIQSDSLWIQLFKPTTLAPAAAIIGILMFMTSKKAKRKEIGQMLVGFGILFAGMFAMEAAVKPLQASPIFPQILAAMSNPVLGVLVGTLITAVIQSSAASIGMLQALSSTGMVRFSTAFPIIMGQNIGTCITSLLSSVGASRNAKRSALIHLYFNIVGTVVFLVAIYAGKALFGTPSFWNLSVGRTGIANFHTVFNLTVTLLFIPFSQVLVKLAQLSIRESDGERQDNVQSLLDDRFLYSPSLALQQAGHVLQRMSQIAQQNYRDSILLLTKYEYKAADRIREAENTIDKLEDKLENYLIRLASSQLSDSDSRSVSKMLHIIKDYERVGDYAINIMECAFDLDQNGASFSKLAIEEIEVLSQAVNEILVDSATAVERCDITLARQIEPLEETVDAIVETLKDRHVERLKQGTCNVHAGIIFLELLTNLERIADHCSNIGVHILETENRPDYGAHEYLKHAHEATDGEYVGRFDGYMNKYYHVIQKMTE
ncbi:MAG: Na/Pi cotransporter family protein [Oscillospiraceae bacterium]